MGTYTVRVAEGIDDREAWDDVVRASGSPLFYRSGVLRSYQRHPLLDTDTVHCLTARDRRSGSLEAVLPAFQVPALDPLDVLGTMLPSFRPGGRPLLLSHVWHWYDTHLPARRLTPELLDAVCRELEDLARRCGAQAYGFINVAGDGRLAELLPMTRLTAATIDARYVIDLRGLTSVDGYLASLGRQARQDLRRQLRRAADAGAEIIVDPAPDRTALERVAALCQTAAAKHGNPGWYDPDRLTGFVGGLEPHTRLVSLRIDGTCVAASISFADGIRFHNWAAGAVPLDQLPFSPYTVLLYATLRTAIQEGCGVLEGGRRNDRWKTRMGMSRRALTGWLGTP
ncbi:GNAT family N-acetyltransferase [Actinomadura rubrisoli]|uniref:GNAT family N-acetyltransferase n=1 Tax=Actinomadura rubrisoli TaxID=2530368 RepID=A0A4R5BM69_9ACTN|nr:GNAT family N-acetyltransferase [Actinomadura rubrisoli]TDD85022.1 GNAT family N-acetyltransferase [Actinomadura rubrisoli]